MPDTTRTDTATARRTGGYRVPHMRRISRGENTEPLYKAEDAAAELNLDSARLDSTLHALRLRLAPRMAEKRRQLAAIQRALDELRESPPAGIDAPAGAGIVESGESDADRAAKLLRAALLLIMGNGHQDSGGGRPAHLQPVRPIRPGPPGGIHADDRPTLPAKDGIAF